ncbi:phosphoribosyltransferase [Patescibacteria group bacterium]|nr:phosphoribosyltransferase [Patescibacteria group bacterium]
MVFKNREEAGKKLSVKLRGFQKKKNLIVLAIPRGGLVVGKQLAQALNCPLDIIVTKKIGAPGNPELAIGAVGAMGEPVLNEELAARAGADGNYLQKEIANRQAEVERRIKEYRGDKLPLNLKDKTVIITDDGVATGATMEAAVEVVRQQEPKKIIVAIPVIARDSLKKLEEKADEVIYLDAPIMFFAVGQFYREFGQVSDEEVKEILE